MYGNTGGTERPVQRREDLEIVIVDRRRDRDRTPAVPGLKREGASRRRLVRPEARWHLEREAVGRHAGVPERGRDRPGVPSAAQQDRHAASRAAPNRVQDGTSGQVGRRVEIEAPRPDALGAEPPTTPPAAAWLQRHPPTAGNPPDGCERRPPMRKIVAEQERGHAVAIELSIGETQLEEDLGLAREADRVAPPGPEQRSHRERVPREEQTCPVESSEREIAGHIVERLDASALDHLREQCRRVGADGAGGFERGAFSPDGIDPCVGNADPIVTLDDRKALGSRGRRRRTRRWPDERPPQAPRYGATRSAASRSRSATVFDGSTRPKIPLTRSPGLLGRLGQQATLSHLGHESGRVRIA